MATTTVTWKWDSATSTATTEVGDTKITVTNIVVDDPAATTVDIDIDEDTKEVIIPKALLGEEESVKVSIENKLAEGSEATSPEDYSLALGADVNEPTTADPEWNISSGTAEYKEVTSAGYTLDATDSKTITYSAAKTDTLVTLTGVNTTNSVEKIEAALKVSGTVITVDLAALSGTGIEIDETGGTSNYTLAVGKIDKPTDVKQWDVNPNGKKPSTAIYQQVTKKEYKIAEGSKSITKLATAEDGDPIKLATITGLAAGLTVADINDGGIDVDIAKNEFNMHLKVLGGAVRLTNEADTKYALTLDKDATDPQCSWTVSNKGVAAYNQVTPIKYTLNDDKDTITGAGKAVTTTLATVSGVNSGLIGASADKLKDILVVTEATGAEGPGAEGATIELQKEAFGMANLTYANANGSKYAFSANADGDGVNTDPGTPPVGPQWVINGTTATYINCESKAHYTEKDAEDKKGNKTTYFEYHAPVVATGAEAQITITGLKKGVTLQGDGSIAGISFEENSGEKTGKILISKELFGGTNIAISGSYTEDNGSGSVTVEDYTLGFVEDELEADDELHVTEANGGSYDTTFVAKKGVATITQKVEKGYTLTENGKGILYSKADGNAVVATVAGLADELETTDFDAATGVITLTKDQLPVNAKKGATVTVTGTGGYTLTTEEATVTESKPAWSVSGTTATYKSTMDPNGTPAYSISADGKSIYYLVAAKDTVYATVSGINANLTDKELKGDNSDPTNVIKPVISFEADGNGEETIIVLQKRALTSANVSAAAGYTIEFGTGVYTSADDVKDLKQDTWVVSGTKAELIECTPAYYEPMSGKKGITYVYHKAEPVADAKPTVTLTGLKKNLMVNADGSIDGIKITPGATAEDPSTITLDSKVLGGGTVTVNGDYVLALDDPTGDLTSDITYKWAEVKNKKTKDRTGMTLTQTRTNGYDVSDDGKTITYSFNKKGDSTTTSLFTLTGIDETYLKDDTKWGTYDKDGTNNDISLVGDTISIDNAAVLSEDTALTVGAKSAYKLAIGFENGGEATTENKWEVIEGKKGALSYAYNRVVTGEGGYALSADSKTISNMKENDSVTLFTLTGLNEDLIKDTDDATDIAIKDAVEVDEDAGTVTLKKAALGTSVIGVAKGSTYKIQLDDDANIKTSAAEVSSNGWVVSGTTAKYQTYKNGYYTHNAAKNTITYTPPSAGSGSATVELKGLKKGIAANQDGTIDGVVMDNAVITLKSSALGTTDVSVSGKINGTDCTLKLYNKDGDDESVPTSETTTKWAQNPKNLTSWTLNQQVTPGYTLESGSKTVKYAAGTNPTALFTLNGLKSDLEDADLANADTVKVDGTTVTLGKDALAGTNVTLALPKKSTATYNLALGNTVAKVAGTANRNEWIVNGTTAIYYDKCTQPYYTVSGTTVTYHPADKTEDSQALITITGLRKGTTLAADDITVSGTTVKLSEALLTGTSKVTISGKKDGVDYTLALADASLKSEPEAPIWTVATKKGTTATLTQVQPKGYICNGSSITAVPKDTTATLVTLSGINADLIDAADEAAEGLNGADAEAKRQEVYSVALKVDTITEKVTIDDSAFVENGTIAVGKGSTYTIKAESEANVTDGVWKFDKKKNATYTETKAAGNITSTDGKSIKNSDSPTDTAIVTIAGFNPDLDDATKLAGAVTIDTNKKEIKLTNAALDPSRTVVIGTKGSPYSFVLDGEVTTTSTEKDGWVITGGKKDSKAEYILSETAYYKLGTDNKSVSYVPTAAKAGAEAQITITGLVKGAVVSNDNIKLDGSVVTLKKSVLGTGTITIEGKANGEDATIKPYNNASDATDPENVPISVLGDAKWKVVLGKKNVVTAILTQEKPAGYVIDGNKVTYVAKPTTVTLATVSGVSPDLVGATDAVINEALKVNGNTITLNKDAIKAGTTTNVTLARGKDISGTVTAYELAIDGSVVTGGSAVQWYVDGQTVKYIECDIPQYKLADNKLGISYQQVKPTDGAEAQATISGLRKKFAPTEGDITKDVEIKTDAASNTKQVVVSENLLSGSGKVTLDGDYTFEFKDDMTTATHKAASIPQTWTNTIKKGVVTGTLTQEREIGYTLSNDSKSITYLAKLPKGGSLVMATVTGLKDVNEKLSSNAGDTTINLAANNLRADGGAVVVDGAGYTFDFADDYKEGKTITAGNSGNIIAAHGDDLTINGGKGNDNITASGQEANINGGAGNDVITTDNDSSGATVAGGAGDDKITLNGKGNNIYVYNIGEGNDVINNFKTGDTIKLNSYLASKFTSGSVKLEKDGSDLVVTVAVGVKKKQGTITLKGAGDQSSVSFEDKDGDALTINLASSGNAVETPVVPTNELLYSSNYSQDAAQLDQITPTSVNDYSVGDINTNQDATALTQNATIVTTSTNKK